MNLKPGNLSLIHYRNRKLLGQLKAGQKGIILEVGVMTKCFSDNSDKTNMPDKPNKEDDKADLSGGRLEVLRRLQELGILEGATFKVMSEAPFGKDPIAIKVRNSVFALRRSEADEVLVQVDL